MKVRDVSITKGMTINLGGHQFHKAEIGMTAVFEDGDDFEAGLKKLTALVNSKLATEITQVTSENVKKPAVKRQVLMETEQILVEREND